MTCRPPVLCEESRRSEDINRNYHYLYKGVYASTNEYNYNNFSTGKKVKVMKKKTTNWKVASLALMVAAMPFCADAQDKVETSVGADLVSGYIWRGQELGGVSLQPSLSVAYKGFSIGAWGSVGMESSDTKEFDLTVGYSTGGFSLSVTDYWFNVAGDGEAKYFHYSSRSASNSHVFEAQIGYDFGPLALNWYTNFAGADGVKANGKRAYSSYIAAAVPFKLGELEWTAEAGATPWETSFYGSNGFAVVDLSIGASKEIKVTDAFSLPLFAKATWNPRTEGAYLTVGISF